MTGVRYPPIDRMNSATNIGIIVAAGGSLEKPAANYRGRRSFPDVTTVTYC